MFWLIKMENGANRKRMIPWFYPPFNMRVANNKIKEFLKYIME